MYQTNIGMQLYIDMYVYKCLILHTSDTWHSFLKIVHTNMYKTEKFQINSQSFYF